jgi:uncharacterized protein YciI
MKKLFTFLLFICVITTMSAQKSNPNYNPELAKKLNADDYGMKKFIFVMLKTGTNTSTDKELKNKSFASHMKNTDSLVKVKKMVVAGPFFRNNDNYRGIFILAVDSIEKAKALLKNDQAISKKYLEAVYYEWYGSAALGQYLNDADKIWKVGF